MLNNQGKGILSDEDQGQPFCFWDAKSAQDVYFLAINIAIIILLLTVTLYRIIKTFKFINKQIKIIYGLIILWGIVFLAQYVYALCIFFIYLNQEDGLKDIPEYSRVYSLFDAIPGYTIQTIFYYVWVLMFGNIKNIALKLELSLSRCERIGYPIIQFYFYFRLVIKITVWVLALISKLDELWLYNSINILVLLTDAIILNLLLIFSLPIFLRRIDSFKLGNSQNQKKKLKYEYIFMIIASALRFILDLQLLIIEPLTSKKFLHCINNFQDHLQFTLQYTLFGTIIMQFLPIFIILKLYHFKKQDRQNFKKNYNDQNRLQNSESRSSQSIRQVQQIISHY